MTPADASPLRRVYPGEDAPDVLVVDERLARALAAVLGRVLIGRAPTRRAA